MLSVIIPAHNEASYIRNCLDAVLASGEPPSSSEEAAKRHGAWRPSVEVIVVANACSDATAEVSREYTNAVEKRGWRLIVLDIEKGGKANALNAGDRAASGDILVYLDADVLVSPQLLAQLQVALGRPEPAYASGRLTITPAKSWVTRSYARLWLRVPYMADTVPGCGVFAVNTSGRARWGTFPDTWADDVFARLQFAPHERSEVSAPYQWPVTEGFPALVRVRRRQDIWTARLFQEFPALTRNEDKPVLGPARLLRLIAKDPLGFLVYASVSVAARVSRGGVGQHLSRGR